MYFFFSPLAGDLVREVNKFPCLILFSSFICSHGGVAAGSAPGNGLITTVFLDSILD